MSGTGTALIAEASVKNDYNDNKTVSSNKMSTSQANTNQSIKSKMTLKK